MIGKNFNVRIKLFQKIRQIFCRSLNTVNARKIYPAARLVTFLPQNRMIVHLVYIKIARIRQRVENFFAVYEIVVTLSLIYKNSVFETILSQNF